MSIKTNVVTDAPDEGLGPAPDGTTARVYAIVARRGRRAVVFRRGPSKWTRMLLWDLDSDTLQGGQWFKGHIYERRCDLSPDGTMLAYFAASFRKPFYSWTALSRPPYFTALALWPKGDAWGGGGLFASTGLLELNHRPGPDGSFPLANGFKVPPTLALVPMGDYPGSGEDLAVEIPRLQRDGWTYYKSNHVSRHKAGRYFTTFDPPTCLQRPIKHGATLDVLTHALHEHLGRWTVQSAVVRQGAAQRDLGRIDWADADHNGDVLYAAAGCLYRIGVRKLMTGDAVLVADLNGMAFEPMEAPRAALR